MIPKAHILQLAGNIELQPTTVQKDYVRGDYCGNHIHYAIHLMAMKYYMFGKYKRITPHQICIKVLLQIG